MESNTQNFVMRGSMAGLWAIVSYYAGNLTPLFYLMIVFGLVNVILDIIVEWYEAATDNVWNSKIILHGFVRKIACIFLVGVALGIDFMILEADKTFNLPMQWGPYFGLFALCYLILSEGISILESIDKMGVNIPFLMPMLKALKKRISNNAQGKLQMPEDEDSQK